MESKYQDEDSRERRVSTAVRSAAATKGRLEELMSKFDNFELEMVEGTRNRREKDEHELEELKQEMARIEQVLQTEMRERVEMNKSLQIWCGKQVEAIHEDLMKKIAGNMETLQENIDALHMRIDGLEEALATQKKIIPADIERRGEELTKMLTEFQNQFEEEGLARLERERAINSRLSAQENKVTEEMDKERGVREKKYQQLRTVLEESVALRKSRVERFHVKIEAEIAKLKNSIQQESILREKEDDEIANTLSVYTAKLQDSLRVINAAQDV